MVCTYGLNSKRSTIGEQVGCYKQTTSRYRAAQLQSKGDPGKTKYELVGGFPKARSTMEAKRSSGLLDLSLNPK